VAAFIRLADKWLGDLVGKEMKDSEQMRLEASGSSLIFSICKLAHSGWGCYAKGDGEEWMEHLLEAAGDWATTKLGRAACGARQDGVLELSSDIYPLIDALLNYTNETRQSGPNVLRDSIFVRLRLLPFQAYIHTCAMVWEIGFEELRALTNSSEAELNPLEINELYEKVHEFGTLIQSPDALSIFEEGYRIWPQHPKMESWYAKREKKRLWTVDKATKKRKDVGALHEKKLEGLRWLDDRDDWEKYEPLLRDALRLFGEGIHESFERTMKNYLEATGGDQRLSEQPTWVKLKAVHMLAHNNKAESPFATAKYLNHVFQSMSLAKIAGLTHAAANGTFKLAGSKGKTKKTAARPVTQAGAAITAPAALRAAVSLLCSVRVKSDKVTKETTVAGTFAQSQRAARAGDEVLQSKRRAERKAADIAENTKKKAKTAQAIDAHHEIQPVQSETMLMRELGIRENKGDRVTYLKEQVKARISGRGWTYPESHVGSGFRRTDIKSRPLKLTPPASSSVREQEDAYLTRLLTAMVAFDKLEGRYTAESLASSAAEATHIYRPLAIVNQDLHSAHAVALEAEVAAVEAANMVQQDDEELLAFDKKYTGKHLLDGKDVYRIVEITTSREKKKGEEAVEHILADAVKLGEDGKIPALSKKGGLLKKNKLVSFGVQSSDGTAYATDQMIAKYEEGQRKRARGGEQPDSRKRRRG